jgi:glycosyltransferase involved in cell wall biosynthesis
MKQLVLICARNPDLALERCLAGLDKFYPDWDIVIIDSNSDDTSMYGKIKRDNLTIHLSNNVNYELGAWNIGYELYPDYDYYMCIQDTLQPIRMALPIPDMKKNEIYIKNNSSGFRWGTAPTSLELTKGTAMEELVMKYAHPNAEEFVLAPDSSFISSNENLKSLLALLPNLPTNKEGSKSTERLIGLGIVHMLKLTPLFLNPAFKKTHGKRL